MRVVPEWSIQTSWWVSGIFATGAIWYFLSLKQYGYAGLAGLGAIAFAFLAVSLHRKKDKLSTESGAAAREASDRFRSAFAEAVTQLGQVDSHWLMNKLKIQHDVAIFEFKRYVSVDQQGAFDAAVERFKGCRDTLSPAVVEAMHSMVTGEPIDVSDEKRLAQALHDLLAFSEV